MRELQELRVVGRAVPRRDSREKVRGRQAYLSDVGGQDALVARLIRSPHPRAKLVHLPVEDIRRIPGVVTVFRAKDVPRTRFNSALAPQSDQLRGTGDRFLLTDTPRHVGDGVAVVVATSAGEARAATELAESLAEWRVLAPVLSIEEALDSGRIIGKIEFGAEDVEALLAHSAVRVDETFEIAAAQHVCLETHTCRAEPNGRGVSLWSNTQSPAELQELVSQVIGLDPRLVHVRKFDEGGGFGCRQEMYDEALLCWLATRLRRAVFLSYDRAEELSATRRRHDVRLDVSLGLDANGRMTALNLSAVVNSGAYASHTPYVANALALAAPSLYPHAAYRFGGSIVSTNTMPTGAYRGYGMAQASFAVEAALDMAGRALGRTPVEVRRVNALLRKGADEWQPNKRLLACLEKGLADERYSTTAKPGDGPVRIGTGLAIAVKGTTAGDESDFSSALVDISSSGAVTLFTGTCDSGTGSSTVLAQVVAEELGVPVDSVDVVEGDTARGPVDVGSAAQRSVFLGAGAARAAARIARSEPRKPVVFQGRRAPASYCACFVTVAVDVELGTVRVDDCLVVVDCGRVLNPLGAVGQAIGAAVQGLGLALIDQWSVDEAGRGPSSIQDHGVPTALDVPSVRALFTNQPVADAPYGGLGMGELPIVPIAAAVANAVGQATGAKLTQTPMRPETVWRTLNAHTERKGGDRATT